MQQQAVAAQAQQRADAIAKLNGPAPGSPEYIAQLSSKVTAETDAAKKYILGPAAVVEGAGLVTVAATGATAEAVANGARAGYSAGQSASLHAGAAIDLTVPGGVIAATQFVQAALQPAKAAPTPAGLLGVVTNFTYKAIQSLF